MKSIPYGCRRRNAASVTLLVGFCIVHRIFFRLSVESYVQSQSVSLYSSPFTPTAPTSIGRRIISQTRCNGSRIQSRNTPFLLRNGAIRHSKFLSSFALSATRHEGPERKPSPDEPSSEIEKSKYSPLLSSLSSSSIQNIRNPKSTSITKFKPATDFRPLSSRRAVLATLSTTTAAAALFASSSAARASVAEIDKSTGLLYTPKKEMLAGGSAAARGVRIEQSADNSARAALKLGEQIQNVYGTRFIAYLSRFLINFDDAANGYWISQTKELDGQPAAVDLKFAEFSESVEIGLADYFIGPYGSYASLSAMKAGISAKYQAKSKRYVESENDSENGFGRGVLRKLASGLKSRQKTVEDELTRKEVAARNRFAKQGILNLYTLLKARYKSKAAKLQLAILFSFISNPATQPTAEIRSLLAEADDASVTKLELQRVFVRDEITSRTSCKRGGGYAAGEPPVIAVDVPPALGSAYKLAKAESTIRCTSRVLRINVLDGGAGYTKCPDVYVSPPGAGVGSSRQCVAQAILDRKGQIEYIVVLDPGYGYGRDKNKIPPKIIIKPPDDRGMSNTSGLRQAVAKADLEYEIASIAIVESGNGFVDTEPPKVYITPPEQEPDWYVDVADLAVLDEPSLNRQIFGASVVEMQGPKGNIAYSPEGIRPGLPENALKQIREDPVELLPTIIRPEIGSNGKYYIPSVADVRTKENVLDNPRFRAVDPLFGAIGALPAQKSALELKPNEYGRLALSGAVCTVLVRTALNPLELIKTKLQLENDEELLSYARSKAEQPDPHGGESKEHAELSSSIMQTKTSLVINATTATKETEFAGDLAVATATTTASTTETMLVEGDVSAAQAKLGSQDLISSLIEMRGFPAIFQSADITLLASIMFGSLGFGATELFRRSFTQALFEADAGGGGNGGQLILLAAATLATIITCAAAAPFELLRVRSMGLVEAQKWTEVMKGFLKEKAANGKESNDDELDLKRLSPKDYFPLWAGFGPTTSRELAFAIPKFLAFDLIAKTITGLINSQMGQGALPIQVGVGGAGLAISAFSGAFAGIAGAIVSHPADLILTRLSASSKLPSNEDEEATAAMATNGTAVLEAVSEEPNWKDIVTELLAKEGGVANLYVGLAPRLVFFFLVIGLQFFLYDYVKNLLEVGSDDLSLVLDVFYAVRQGLIEQSASGG